MTAASPEAAVANGRAVTSYPRGYCQKYVRDPCWRVGSLYGSAIEAWNGARLKHPGDRNPPPGAPCYYRGGSYGHAVISVGGGRIRSTDCPTSTVVSDTDIGWPERAWGYTYLGWTEDLNGVVLPGLGDDATDANATDDDKEGTDMPGLFKANGEPRTGTGDWQPIAWESVGGSLAELGSDGNPGVHLGGYRAVYTLTAHVDGSPSMGQVATRLAVGEGRGNDFEVTRTTPAAPHGSRVVDTRADSFGADTWGRFQIKAPKGAQITGLHLTLLGWKS